MRLRLLLAAALALAAASPAHAATVLLADDAEGAIEDKWVVGDPTNPLIQPWQKSDSATPKARGNQANGGSASYWSGSSPGDFRPTEIVEGSSFLTTKASFIVPADGKTTLSLWSLFQNEGDDAGLVEVAPDEGGKPGKWRKLTEYKLAPAAVGDTDVYGYCNPSDPAGTLGQPFEEVKGDFAAFAGQAVWLRLHLKYGAENRSATQPCGWYVDDIKVETTGTPGNLGTPDPGTPPPGGGPAPATTAKLGSFKAKGRRATVKVTVGGGTLSDVVVTLRKGRKKLATAKAASLAEGTRTLRLKLKRKLRKGKYALTLAGKASDGSAVTAKGTGRVR